MIRTSFASLFSPTLLATVLAACATDTANDDLATGGGKADGATPTISFAGDWSERLNGDLLAGSAVRISYNLDRLPDCRGSSGGSEVWGATGYASFDGAEPITFAVSQLVGGRVKASTASLEIPAGASSVDLWFASNNRWGCIAYDSNQGANYHFEISRGADGAVLSFDADWSESQSAAIRAGDAVVVHYDPARLAQCQYSSGGRAGWSITAHYKVDGGATKSLLVTRAEGSTLVPADPTITIPRGRNLSLWFDATSAYGCHAYDSNMNANYQFSIQ